MRDMVSNYDLAVSVPPIAISEDREGAAVDLRGYRAATVEIAVGAFSFTGSHKIEWKLEHSDAADTGFAPVAIGDVLGVAEVGTGGIVHTNGATVGAGGQVAKIGYIGGKRYIRVIADQTGTTTTAVASAIVNLGIPLLRAAA